MVRRGLRKIPGYGKVRTPGLKPVEMLNALRGPFDFAQGRLLKRRSSTALTASGGHLKSQPSKARNLAEARIYCAGVAGVLIHSGVRGR